MNNYKKIDVITIDGPSGCGKGTISVMLAKHLNWHFLDSGLLYRALAWYAHKMKSVDLTNENLLSQLALELPVEFIHDQVLLAGQNVTLQLRGEQTGSLASQIAVFPKVRQALLDRQHAFRAAPGLVADGRDMGTVVFKDARLKFFLDASVEVRAKRRFLQLKQQGVDGNLQSLMDELSARDLRDKQRAVAPLVPANDAIVIDTSAMSVDQVFAEVMDRVTVY